MTTRVRKVLIFCRREENYHFFHLSCQINQVSKKLHNLKRKNTFLIDKQHGFIKSFLFGNKLTIAPYLHLGISRLSNVKLIELQKKYKFVMSFQTSIFTLNDILKRKEK